MDESTAREGQLEVKPVDASLTAGSPQAGPVDEAGTPNEGGVPPANPVETGTPVPPAGGPAPVAAPASSANPQASTSGLAIAGLVLGVLAILGAFIPLLNIFTAPFAVVGLVLAIVGFVGINNGKHTGKGIAVAGIVLGAVALVVTVGMYGCAGAVAGSSGNDSPAASSSAAQASSSAAESQGSSPAQGGSATAASDSSALVGIWDMTELVANGQKASSDDLEMVRNSGVDMYLELKQDGAFVLVLDDSKTTGTWEQTDAGAVALTGGGSVVNATIKDGSIVMEDASTRMVFTKRADGSQQTPDAAPSEQADPEPEAPAAAEGVTPEVKEALDSYEAFIDEYVAFMQKYKESDDAVAMMGDYADFMQRYTDFAAKIDAMDTENMSSADYAYYLEVTSRVAQKLLAAY